MKLILVRHGETDSNKIGLALGREDVPLNATGQRQAQLLAHSLRDEPIAAVYTSPLRRALTTAQVIAESQGLTAQVEEGLMEMDVGEMEGMTFAEVRQRYGDFLRRWVGPEAGSVIMPGASENLDQVQARAWAVVERLTAQHRDETVVAVSHNFVILCILCRALGVALADFRSLRHNVAAKSILDLRPNRAVLLCLNDTCHLNTDMAGPLAWDWRR